MSSPPGTSKQKKGIRRLLKDSFSRSRSQSPSQSHLQPEHEASSTTTRPDEGVLQIASPGGGASRLGSTTPITYLLDPSPLDNPVPVGGPLDTPDVIEPVDIEPRAARAIPELGIAIQIDQTAAHTSTDFVQHESQIPTLIDPTDGESSPAPSIKAPESIIGSRGTDNPEDITWSVIPPNQAQKTWNVAWDGLRKSLRFLSDSSSALPHLSSALEPLLACLDGLEITTQNRQDFEELANGLSTLSESLGHHVDGSSSIFVSSSMIGIAMTIERQGNGIRDRLDHMRGGIGDAKADEEELVKHYRRIQFCFRQLQTNATMSTWSIANEHLVNARLEGLSPVKQATYDSSLSTQINRRGCTEGTRVGVLAGIDGWLHNTTSPSIYWMNGMAGTGKTTIASTFCERVEERKLLAASFFCTRSSAECRNVARIVPTIAYQLARYSAPFQSALCKILGQNPDIGSKNVLRQFEQLLKEPLKQVKEAIPEDLVVVIDALDECDDRNGVELVLDMLFRHAPDVPLKFLITSRPEPEIYSKMLAHTHSREVLHLHDIEKSLVRADIELYLREELDFMSPPVSRAEIEQLVQRSGTLFIYAATLVRYVRTGKRLADPHKRLRSILGMAPDSRAKVTQIDALYTTVLKSALSGDELEADEIEDIRVVLRTVLFAQEPIGVETIAELAEIDDKQRVAYALHPLRSVLYQSEETGLVSTLHASFPDFMFSYERSGIYFYDVVEHSQVLARRCFVVMKEQLRFNICDLTSSFFPDKEVENLQEKIKANISPTLAYACCYWASHLVPGQSSTLLTLLEDFLSHRLLFWMEVLSLRREMSMGIDELQQAYQWLIHYDEHALSKLALFVGDARNFLTSFAVNPTSKSTPHLYISSLPFCSPLSLVYQHYWKRSKGLLALKGSLIEARKAAPLAVWNVGLRVLSLALSPDGSRVVIGCYDAKVSILSAYDGTFQVEPLQGHTDVVSSVAFSPDGGRIVSAARGGIRLWNAHDGTLLAGPLKGHIGIINSVSFSPDGARVLSGGHDRSIRIWDAYNGTPLLCINHVTLVFCVIFSPSGTLVASPSSANTIQLWNSYDGTVASPQFQGHTGKVECIAFTPDGTRLVSGSQDFTVRIWNVSNGALATNPIEGHTRPVHTVVVSPDGKRVATSCGDSGVRVWDIYDGMLVAGPFYGHSGTRNLAYFPNGTRVISCTKDTSIFVQSVHDGMLPSPPPLSLDAVVGINFVAFRPDGVSFLSSGRDFLRIWDTTDGSFTTYPNKAVLVPTTLSTISPHGLYVASTSVDDKLQILSLIDGSVAAGPFEIEHDSFSTLCFSRNNQVVIVGCYDGTVKICNIQSGNTDFGSFVAHHRRIKSLSESPNRSLLLSHSDYEAALRVWNLATPALDLQLTNPSICSTSRHGYAAFYDGWNIREDGWVANNSQHLLFWLPPDIASAWCSPYATLVITQSGTLQVPNQKLLIGDQWAQCYIPD